MPVAQANGADLSSALLKLYEDNASTLTPDPLYVKFPLLASTRYSNGWRACQLPCNHDIRFEKKDWSTLTRRALTATEVVAKLASSKAGACMATAPSVAIEKTYLSPTTMKPLPS
jgi:hypothetical protein